MLSPYKLTKRYQWLLAICLLMLLIFFSSRLKPWTGEFPWLAPLSYPVGLLESLWHKGSSSVERLWQRYVYLVGVKAESEQLREEVTFLRGRLVDYQAKQREVLELKNLLEFSRNYHHELIVAEVISQGFGGGFASFRIDKGAHHGLKVGMVVLSIKGMVGRVMRVAPMYSDIQPLTSPEARVDILSERTRLRGVLEGTGEGYLQWHPTQRGDIKIGDTVITSGMIPSSPKGFPVAEVVKITYGLDDASQKVILKPWQDIHKLEYVFVLKQKPEVADFKTP